MKIDREEDVFKILRDLKEEIKGKYKVTEIGVFGSFVKNKQDEKSDVDILVDFEERADFFDLVALGLFLEEKLNHKVDVVPRKAVRKELQEGILNEVSFI